MPLRQAVFKYGMTEDDKAAAIHDKPLPGPSEFKEISASRASSRQTTIELEERAITPFSRRQLTRMLKENSGAQEVEIDSGSSTFSFSFYGTSYRSVEMSSGPPWALLEEPRKAGASQEAQFEVEALFNREGFVRICDEEAALHEKQLQSVRKATGLVFRQFMICTFDLAVSTKAVVDALRSRPRSR
jgi:hypothetical protein